MAREQSGTEIIRAFCACWSTLDATALANYFTEDGTYYNMPSVPTQGRANIEQFIAAFYASWTKTDWEILHILEQGNVVIAERVDRIMLGDKAVELPCCGVFELENGKIKVWRDYFDLSTYMKALG
jgi:limonene-1,2-epoxide hydrolase